MYRNRLNTRDSYSSVWVSYSNAWRSISIKSDKVVLTKASNFVLADIIGTMPENLLLSRFKRHLY